MDTSSIIPHVKTRCNVLFGSSVLGSWKNRDVGQGYYSITGAITEWLPLLERPSICKMVCEDIAAALKLPLL